MNMYILIHPQTSGANVVGVFIVTYFTIFAKALFASFTIFSLEKVIVYVPVTVLQRTDTLRPSTAILPG